MSTNTKLITITSTLQSLIVTVNRHFADITARFEHIDTRFQRIDARFKSMDIRFQHIDTRFESIEERFNKVDTDIREIRLSQLRTDKTIARIENYMAGNTSDIVEIYDRIVKLEKATS